LVTNSATDTTSEIAAMIVVTPTTHGQRGDACSSPRSDIGS
jgi:hypothetical protein